VGTQPVIATIGTGLREFGADTQRVILVPHGRGGIAVMGNAKPSAKLSVSTARFNAPRAIGSRIGGFTSKILGMFLGNPFRSPVGMERTKSMRIIRTGAALNYAVGLEASWHNATIIR